MLDRECWLKKAQALPVGGSDRLFHGRENRPNLVIQNLSTKWVAFCQCCKEGGVVDKEHVRLDVVSPEAKRSDLSLPSDLQSSMVWPEPTTQAIAKFLASKGMDLIMLPNAYYSDRRKRLLVQTAYHPGWMGRDLTGNALEKWLTYNGQHYLLEQRSSAALIAVEDAFSFYKVIWATKSLGCSVMCALGTGMKPSIMTAMLKFNSIYFMFDGDAAGYKGATEGANRMQALGKVAYAACAPSGCDPKDLAAEHIRRLILDRRKQ